MRFSRLLFCVAGLFFSGLVLHAQTTVVNTTPGPGKVTKSADRPTGIVSPVPPLVTTARTVFLANGGADAGLFPHPFTGTQDRGYGSMYNALSAGKHFAMVNSPAEADLVLELTLSAPTATAGGDKQRGTTDALPTFKLVVYDRPTHYVLWALSQTIDKANLQKTHDKNFDDALNLLVKQLETLTTGTAPTAPVPAPAADTGN